MIVPIDLDAQLTLTTGHSDVVVQAEGGRIILEMQDLHTAGALMRRWPGGHPRRVMLERLRPWLLAADLTVELRPFALARAWRQGRRKYPQ